MTDGWWILAALSGWFVAFAGEQHQIKCVLYVCTISIHDSFLFCRQSVFRAVRTRTHTGPDFKNTPPLSRVAKEPAAASPAKTVLTHNVCCSWEGHFVKRSFFGGFGYKFLVFFSSPCDPTIALHRVWTVWRLISHWISVDAFISALLQKILTLASVQSKNTLWGETNKMVKGSAEHQVLHLVVL